MTYVNRFVAAIKAKNQFLREIDKEIVKLPFDTEYSIYLKNMNSRKAKVHITIDDNYIGGDLILSKNEYVTLERFIDNNLNDGPKFKFIQKTEENKYLNGNSPIDGIVRIEITYEKEKPYDFYYSPVRGINLNYQYGDNSYKSSGTWTTATTFTSSLSSNPVKTCEFSAVCSEFNADEGMTIKGENSNQSFNYGYIGELESESEVIIFNLKGYKEDPSSIELSTPLIKIEQPVTVKTHIYCANCGTKNKYLNNYCFNCGTKLEK